MTLVKEGSGYKETLSVDRKYTLDEIQSHIDHHQAELNKWTTLKNNCIALG